MARRFASCRSQDTTAASPSTVRAPCCSRLVSAARRSTLVMAFQPALSCPTRAVSGGSNGSARSRSTTCPTGGSPRSPFSDTERGSGRRLVGESGFDHVGSSDIARLRALAEPVGDASLGLCRARRAGLELDLAVDDTQAHRCEPPQARSIEIAHLDWLVGGARLIGGQEPAEGACHVDRIRRCSLDVALERNGSEMERGSAGILLVDPVAVSYTHLTLQTNREV